MHDVLFVLPGLEPTWVFASFQHLMNSPDVIMVVTQNEKITGSRRDNSHHWRRNRRCYASRQNKRRNRCNFVRLHWGCPLFRGNSYSASTPNFLLSDCLPAA